MDVLVIDRNAQSATALCELFGTAGRSSRFVRTGEAALEALGTEPFGALVFDSSVEAHFGSHVALSIRNQFPNIIFVFLSADLPNPEYEKRFDYRFQKPVDFGLLLNVVNAES